MKNALFATSFLSLLIALAALIVAERVDLYFGGIVLAIAFGVMASATEDES